MTEKDIVLETIRALPDDCSLDEVAERIEFMAADALKRFGVFCKNRIGFNNR